MYGNKVLGKIICFSYMACFSSLLMSFFDDQAKILTLVFFPLSMCYYFMNCTQIYTKFQIAKKQAAVYKDSGKTLVLLGFIWLNRLFW